MNHEIADNSRACCNCANGTIMYPNCYCWQHKDCNGDKPYKIPKETWLKTAERCEEFELGIPEEADVYLELHRIMSEESKDKNPKPMKANGLMIGDWVFDGDEVARVTSLTCDGIIETTRRISNIEIITPIPLTPEILEKTGFERNLVWHYYRRTCGEYVVNVRLGYANKIDFVEIREGGKDDVVPSEKTRLYLPHISYVHQLQHALRLCGIEKEITL